MYGEGADFSMCLSSDAVRTQDYYCSSTVVLLPCTTYVAMLYCLPIDGWLLSIVGCLVDDSRRHVGVSVAIMLYVALHTVIVKQRPFLIHRSRSTFVLTAHRPTIGQLSFINRAGAFYKPKLVTDDILIELLLWIKPLPFRVPAFYALMKYIVLYTHLVRNSDYDF